MKKQILKISLFQLQKLEVQEFATSVIDIVEKHDPETLQIKEIFDILVEQKPQIKLLKFRYGPHRITQPLSELRKQRNAIAQGLITKLRTIEYTKKSGTEGFLKIAKPDVHRYLLALSKQTEEIITAKVNQFLEFVEEDEALKDALEALDLSADLNDLKAVVNAIALRYNDRRESISKRPKMNTRKLVAAIMSDILDLFKQIEVAQIKNKDIDYAILVDELNNEIAHYKAVLKARASINKKKADGVLDDNDTGETDGGIVVEGVSEEPSGSTQTATRMIPLSAGVDNEDNLGQLDIKKTVAMSGKETRLPIVSTEA